MVEDRLLVGVWKVCMWMEFSEDLDQSLESLRLLIHHRMKGHSYELYPAVQCEAYRAVVKRAVVLSILILIRLRDKTYDSDERLCGDERRSAKGTITSCWNMCS